MTHTERADIKVGDIFSCSWGYDQTNVDFYMCVGFTKHFMKYIHIESVVTENDGFASEQVEPAHGYIGDHKVRRAKLFDFGNGPGFAPASYSWATKWDGNPVQQTAPGYGH